MVTLFLSIGSNINPEANFRNCAAALQQHFEQIKWSPVYRSEPVGMSGDDFLNAVVSACTSLSVSDVVMLLKQLELDHGRDQSMRGFNSRTIDIDLLLYDALTIDTADITLPHKDLSNAAFVLVPMVDLDANRKHPTTGHTFQQMLDGCVSREAEFASRLRKVKLKL